jgi:hypothetical protein
VRPFTRGLPTAATGFGIDGLDVHQQCIVAQMAALRTAGFVHEVLVKSRQTDSQHPALHRDRPHPSVALDKGVLHRCALAKYTVAVSRMSRSIFTRTSSARRRLISICSALTALQSAQVSVPCPIDLAADSFALEQLEEALGHRVVEAVAATEQVVQPAHASAQRAAEHGAAGHAAAALAEPQ